MKPCPSCATSNQDLALSCVSCGMAFGTMQPSWRGSVPGSPEAVATTPASQPDLIAGRYRLIEQLGKGGAGVVYRAWDTKLEEDTAIKILQQDENADGAEIGRFKREITTARKITHPNVIRIHDFGESGKDVFISMEILLGGTLGRRMREGMSLAEGLAIAAGVCEGVQAAHALGIVHRDLKPDNMIFDSEGRPKVVDFGLARLQMASTRTVGFSGTPFYMSPEHANGSEVTTRSDVYSLGVVFYQLFTGRLPFSADNFLRLVTMHCHEAPPAPRSIAPSLPLELEQVLLKSLEKDPKKRHANAGEMAAELKRVAARHTDPALIRTNPDAGPSLRMPGPVPLPVHELGGRRSRAPLFAAGGGAIAILVVIAVLVGPTGKRRRDGRASAKQHPAATAIAAATSAALAAPTPDTTSAPAATVLPAMTPRRTPAPIATRVAMRPVAIPVRTAEPAPTRAAGPAMGQLKVVGSGYFEIWIDNVKQGTAPFSGSVKAGSHVIKLVAPGPPVKVKSHALSVAADARYELFFDVDTGTLETKTSGAQKR